MAEKLEVQGTFNAQRFFDTLAMIISRKENVKVTVTVTEQRKQQHKEAV